MLNRTIVNHSLQADNNKSIDTFKRYTLPPEFYIKIDIK